MYVNTKGNSGNKGGNKKDRPLCTHCNMLGHTVNKCYKLLRYPPEYKHKGKPNANANQVSYPQGNVVEVPSNASAQCPISKAQCEQLLALFNSGADQGDNHHVASVSTSGSVSSLTPGAYGVPIVAGVTSTSVSPSANANFNYINTMSGNNPSLFFKPTLKHSIFSIKIVDREVFHVTDWVIDTKATDHMVHFISCFTSISTTLNTYVNLPNGEIALVTHISIVRASTPARVNLSSILHGKSYFFYLILSHF